MIKNTFIGSAAQFYGVTGSGAVVLASNPVFVTNVTVQCSNPALAFIGTEASAKTWQVTEIAGVLSIVNNTDGITKLTLGPAASTAGHVLRSNGTGFVDAALGAADLSNGATGTGEVVLASNPILPNNTDLRWLDDAAVSRSVLTTDAGGSVYLHGYHASIGLELDNGATYIGVSGQNIFGLAVAPAASAVPHSSTVVSGYTFAAQGTAGLNAFGPAAPASITVVGGIVTAATAVSDEHLKISKPYDGGLDEVLRINPIKYKWNEEGQKLTGYSGEREFVGFVAQNVQKTIPEAVGQEGDYLSLDDRPILAAAINAIKALEARVKELEIKNART